MRRTKAVDGVDVRRLQEVETVIPLAPHAKQQGGYSVRWDKNGVEHRTYSWMTRCAECKQSWSSPDQEGAEKMWWEHIASEHPTVWAIHARLESTGGL